MCQRALSEGGVYITHQHFTHNQHVAHTSTAVFSTSVVAPVLLVSQCLCSLLVFWTQCCADRMFIRGSKKRALSHGSGALAIAGFAPAVECIAPAPAADHFTCSSGGVYRASVSRDRSDSTRKPWWTRCSSSE